jgi:hypothetical protein
MTRDVRAPLNDIPITGIDQRIDNQINERFGSLMRAIAQLQARTLLEPRSIPPYKPYDGQVELADGVGWDPLGLGGEYLCWFWQGEWRAILDDRHVALTPPNYVDDPHKQYWHVIRDAGWMHLYFQDFAAPKAVATGGVITGWTGNYLTDWQLVSDPVAGTVTIAGSADFPATGAYQMSVTGFLDGGSNQDSIVTLYLDGAPTAVRMPAITRGSATTAAIAWSGVVNVATEGVFDLRLETGSGISIYNINWSMHRISPPAGDVGSLGGPNGIPPGQPLPPNWGGPP